MKQHFLPQCYLKEFLNQEGKLHSLDLHRLKFKKKVFDEPKFTAEVCWKKDIYTIKPTFEKYNNLLSKLDPLYVEQQFYFYENNYSYLIQNIKNKTDEIPAQDAKRLIYALIDIKIRNPYFRNKAIDQNIEPILDNILNESVDEDELIALINVPKDKLKNIILSKKEEHASRAHISALLSHIDESNLCNDIAFHLMKFNWVVFESDNSFITTDNPGFLITKDNRILNTGFRKDFFFFIPLTPSYCLTISDAIIDKEFVENNTIKKIKYHSNPNMIDVVNCNHGIHIDKYMFSNSKNKIQEMADLINKNAGL